MTLLSRKYRLLFYKSVLFAGLILYCFAFALLSSFHLLLNCVGLKKLQVQNKVLQAIKDGKDQQLSPRSERQQPQQTEVTAQNALLFWD